MNSYFKKDTTFASDLYQMRFTMTRLVNRIQIGRSYCIYCNKSICTYALRTCVHKHIRNFIPWHGIPQSAILSYPGKIVNFNLQSIPHQLVFTIFLYLWHVLFFCLSRRLGYNEQANAVFTVEAQESSVMKKRGAKDSCKSRMPKSLNIFLSIDLGFSLTLLGLLFVLS